MSIGQIVQVIGAVVDIEFPRDAMPKIYEALVLKNDEADSLAENGLTFEVEQQLGDGVVRTIAMGTSEGLRRGMKGLANTRDSRFTSSTFWFPSMKSAICDRLS